MLELAGIVNSTLEQKPALSSLKASEVPAALRIWMTGSNVGGHGTPIPSCWLQLSNLTVTGLALEFTNWKTSSSPAGIRLPRIVIESLKGPFAFTVLKS